MVCVATVYPAGFMKLSDFLDNKAASLNRGVPAEFEIKELVSLGLEKVDVIRQLSEVGSRLTGSCSAASTPAFPSQIPRECVPENERVKSIVTFGAIAIDNDNKSLKS